MVCIMADGCERLGADAHSTPCGAGICTEVEEYCLIVTYCDGCEYGEL